MQSHFSQPALVDFVALMLVFELKHYLADFVLQTNWIARGKDCTIGWQRPLAVHAGLHGLGTLCIALVAAPSFWWLAPLDMLVHGSIDRGKAVISLRKRFPITDARFWWLLGFDQLLHQVTNILLVAFLLS